MRIDLNSLQMLLRMPAASDRDRRAHRHETARLRPSRAVTVLVRLQLIDSGGAYVYCAGLFLAGPM